RHNKLHWCRDGRQGRNWRRGLCGNRRSGRRRWSDLRWNRDSGDNGARRGGRECRNGCRGNEAIGWETHAPEAGGRLRELQFHVSGHAAIVFRFDDLTDDFLFRFFVGEENELAGREGRGEADDSAVAEDQDGLGVFGERLALVRAFNGAGAVHRNRDFQSDRLRPGRGFVLGFRGGGGRSGRNGRCNRSFGIFHNGWHSALAQKGIWAGSPVQTELPSSTSLWWGGWR